LISETFVVSNTASEPLILLTFLALDEILTLASGPAATELAGDALTESAFFFSEETYLESTTCVLI
jgi:hypothetical protein